MHKPNHIAIIMDGNGRAATKKGLPRSTGHELGVNAVRAAVKGCIDENIKYLSVYAFSTENWGRPPEEVHFIINLVFSSFSIELHKLIEQGVKILFIGNRSVFSKAIQDEMASLEQITQSNEKLVFTLFFNYGARWEIVEATKQLAKKIGDNQLDLETVSEDIFAPELASSQLPEPNLIIRTGGECRLSNFLLWSASEALLYFTNVLWPDFNKEEFELAIKSFSTQAK